MNSQALAIVESGMVSGVGLDVPLPPVRPFVVRLSNFQETRFMDSGGEWIIGSSVPLELPWRGISKLSKMLASVLRECIACEPTLNIKAVPILICLAERTARGATLISTTKS